MSRLEVKLAVTAKVRTFQKIPEAIEAGAEIIGGDYVLGAA